MERDDAFDAVKREWVSAVDAIARTSIEASSDEGEKLMIQGRANAVRDASSFSDMMRHTSRVVTAATALLHTNGSSHRAILKTQCNGILDLCQPFASQLLAKLSSEKPASENAWIVKWKKQQMDRAFVRDTLDLCSPIDRFISILVCLRYIDGEVIPSIKEEDSDKYAAQITGALSEIAKEADAFNRLDGEKQEQLRLVVSKDRVDIYGEDKTIGIESILDQDSIQQDEIDLAQSCVNVVAEWISFYPKEEFELRGLQLSHMSFQNATSSMRINMFMRFMTAFLSYAHREGMVLGNKIKSKTKDSTAAEGDGGSLASERGFSVMIQISNAMSMYAAKMADRLGALAEELGIVGKLRKHADPADHLSTQYKERKRLNAFEDLQDKPDVDTM
jgi:hypothetical protein